VGHICCGMGMMKHMDKIFLKKVSDVIDRNIEDEAFGISDLCKELGVSRSKLHRKLKSLAGKSTSQFIREFRLKRARELLRNNEATAAEIAYSVGFNSPSYFSTAFHNYFGYSPSEVKNQDSSSFDSDVLLEITDNFQRKPRLRDNGILIVLLMGLVLILAILAINYSAEESPEVHQVESVTEKELSRKSIGILPFDVLSEQKQDQYFTSGLMASIQNNLSQINGLKVVSQQSVERFKDSSTSPSRISKELGIDYLLIGTIARHKDSARIIVSLLDAPQDILLKSMVFDKKYKDIFSVQTDITEKIAEELEMTISSELNERIENTSTKNPLAYDLYLQGNQYLEMADRHHQEYEEWMQLLDKAELFFELALEKDSLFAEAYVGKALVSLERNLFLKYGDHNYLDKVLTNANKAISINPDLSSGYEARSLYFLWTEQRELAIKDYERSLVLAPSKKNEIQLQLYGFLMFYFDFIESIKALREMEKNAKTDFDFLNLYNNYYRFYAKLDDHEKQLFYYDKMLELTDEPKNSLWWFYFRTQKFDEAISCIKEFYPNNNQTRVLLLANVYNQKGELNKALDYYDKWIDLVKIEGKNNMYSVRDLHRYGQVLVLTGQKEKGMQLIQEQISINKNLIQSGKGNNTLCYDMVGIYSFLNQKEQAFYWMGKFDEKKAWFQVPGMNSFVQFDNQFDNIRDEQQFKDWVRRGEILVERVRNDVSEYVALQEAMN
jgi:TolB-like protein/AraC-like DNA-binding protein